MVYYQSRVCLERYRSGHNEAVLKTVCPKGRVGSNPTLSAKVVKLCLLTQLNEHNMQGNIP